MTNSGQLMLTRTYQHFRTIVAIAGSKSVERFVIGYTGQGSWRRFGQYRKENCSHLVVIADGLTNAQAAMLEMELQQRIWSDKRTVLYRKYDAKRRDKRGFYGAPQRHHRMTDRNHVVYMAWWERARS